MSILAIVRNVCLIKGESIDNPQELFYTER
jgi:hypothetical protein